MRRSEIIGLPVTDETACRVLAHVAELDFRPPEGALKGLYIQTAGALKWIRYVPWMQVVAVGSRCVVIRGRPTACRAPEPLTQRAVSTAEGTLAGRMAELEFDPVTGSVKGLWLRPHFRAEKLQYVAKPAEMLASQPEGGFLFCAGDDPIMG